MAGRVRDSIGITVYYKGYKSNPEGIPYDKYDGYIQDNICYSSKQQEDIKAERIKQRNEEDNTLLKKIRVMNFMTVLSNSSQLDKCECDGLLFDDNEKISIKYRKNEVIKEIFVKGKICKDCGRKIVERKLILDAYHKTEG